MILLSSKFDKDLDFCLYFVSSITIEIIISSTGHPAKNFTFVERPLNVALWCRERCVSMSVERTFVYTALRPLNVRHLKRSTDVLGTFPKRP